MPNKPSLFPHAGIPRRSAHLAAGAAACALALNPAATLAGGSPEHMLLIIDPANPASMYLGNYYKNARNIPDANVIYMNPGAADFAQFAGPNGNIEAVLGHTRNAGTDRTIHYIVVAPTDQFFISAPGYIVDNCWPVNRFAISSAYSLAFIRPLILGGGVPSSIANGYGSASTTVFPAFDSTTSWASGVSNSSGRRFYIGALLGYTGERGNTVAEIREMIDRSVAVDGQRPAGTFYFMNTTDPARNVRAGQFSSVANAFTSAGGVSETINGVLPGGRHNVMGVVTGWPSPNIDTEDMTLLPGSFADHLTSWAATFDNGSQTKLSSWIRRGASGSAGTVEEPCAYQGKFPHTVLHYFSFRGMSLGEAWFRSSAFIPFQHVFVGDPMTRPYSIFPAVQPNIPSGAQNGTVVITPAVGTTSPAGVGSVDLLINGRRLRTAGAGQPFSINTHLLPDGHNEVRFIAYEGSLMKTAGVGRGQLLLNNHGASASVQPSATSGNLGTQFTFNASAAPPSGAALAELRLIHNGRVVASSSTSPAALRVHGSNLGAGRSKVQVEAIFSGTGPTRITALSQPVELDIEFSEGTPSFPAPVAYSYTRHVMRGASAVVELPGNFSGDASFEIISAPAQATISAGSGPYRIITSNPQACGEDVLTFRITTAPPQSAQSNIATVRLVHGRGPGCIADFDGSGNANIDDFTAFINAYAAADLRADVDASCSLNIDDFTAFINWFAIGCP
jgi:hypothetical protein